MNRKLLILFVVIVIGSASLRGVYIINKINYAANSDGVALDCGRDNRKWYINNCDEIDEYEDFKYYGDKYSEYINIIDISGTNINYIDDIAKYPNLETITVNEDNNIDEIPDLSTAGNHLKNLEFSYAQSASEIPEKEPFTIKKISNLETIPEKLLENGFEIKLNICGIEEITPESKAIIQEYPDVIYVPLPSAMNYNNEAECAKKYYNLAGLDQYGNSYS